MRNPGAQLPSAASVRRLPAPRPCPASVRRLLGAYPISNGVDRIRAGLLGASRPEEARGGQVEQGSHDGADARIDAMAAALLRAHRDRSPIPPLTDEDPDLTPDQAYR